MFSLHTHHTLKEIMTTFAGVLVLLTVDNVVGQALANIFFPEITNEMKKPVNELNLMRTNRFMRVIVFMMIIFSVTYIYRWYVTYPELVHLHRVAWT